MGFFDVGADFVVIGDHSRRFSFLYLAGSLLTKVQRTPVQRCSRTNWCCLGVTDWLRPRSRLRIRYLDVFGQGADTRSHKSRIGGRGDWTAYGYVRVSTVDQNELRQLEGQVLDRVFTDKASGRDTERPQLTELLRFVRDGDSVVVHSMDRLARNLDDLRALVQGLTRRGVRVEFLKEQLVFTGEDSPMANLMLSVMGAFAEFERSLIRERQREGIAWPSSAAPTKDERKR